MSTNSAKKRKPKMEAPVTASKSAILGAKSNHSTSANHNSTSTASGGNASKQETPAKKVSGCMSVEERR